jgi:Rrf2 family transcriptional regulator, iron-sulfur cluster assembly transcription factor
MRLSTKGRYAVMALVDLAARSTGRPTALADIAERQDISLSYLEQLFGKLRRFGLVQSVRGPGGGYLLAVTPAEMRVSDIFRAVDEPMRATRCSPGSPESCRDNMTRCSTHDLWEALERQIHQFLDAVTLADVATRGGLLGASGLSATPQAPVSRGAG